MLRKEKKPLSWFEFSLFSLLHGTLTRQGGVSPPPYDTLNFGINTKDAEENRRANREIACKTLGIKKLFLADQVHGTSHALITPSSPEVSPKVDILLTSSPDCALGVQHADCQAALFYDPKQQAIAAVHAGWRGQAAQIYTETLSLMKHYFSSSPADILVGISPSLCTRHAEFRNYETELPPSFQAHKEGACHFNLCAAAKQELLEQGVKEKHIELSTLCSYCDKAEFFSYRRDGETGRNLTFISL